MRNAPERILEFYSGGLDDHGRTLLEIQAWSNEQLEECHDQIQWLFPVPEPSQLNPTAPLLTPEVIATFSRDDAMKARLRLSFERIVKFFGFTLNTNLPRSTEFDPSL